MNALWLTRLCAYKNSPLQMESAKRLIDLKIGRESILLKRYGRSPFATPSSASIYTTEDLLLFEARAAKHFWYEFRILLQQYPSFETRKPHAPDIVNRLLDIGYHRLTGRVKEILNRYSIPADMGLLHVAHRADSAPLAYDFVEMFRADIVNAEVLRFLRMKKKASETLEPKDIAHFLHEIHERCERKYYLKDFKQCHTYRYYMELQILKCIKAIDHKEPFEPLHLPTRHDTRCLTTSKPLVP